MMKFSFTHTYLGKLAKQGMELLMFIKIAPLLIEGTILKVVNMMIW